jgi:hypothetical protein
MWIGVGIRMTTSVQERRVSGVEATLSAMMTTEYSGDPSISVVPNSVADFIACDTSFLRTA